MKIGTWTQHRGNAARAGVADAKGDAPKWEVMTGDEFRSPVSVAGDAAFVGAHGNGDVIALDRRNGNALWRTRVPNWIHNDIVVADGIAAVGFGDNDWERSAFGASPRLGLGPSGVAAFDARTGRRLWQNYTRGTVMVSPVMSTGMVIVPTGDGVLESYDLHTGARRWSTRLPGYSVMGNPAVEDGVVYTTLDPRSACAHRVRDGAELWCAHIPYAMRLPGHATLSVGTRWVYLTAMRDSSTMELFGAGSFRAVGDRLRGRFAPSRASSGHDGGQYLMALDKMTGRLAWVTFLGAGFSTPGHISGTAVEFGDMAIVISPAARSVIAVSRAEGNPEWRRRLSSSARGAVAIANGHVIIGDRDGGIVILSALTGRDECSFSLGSGFDRASPTVAAGSAIFASLSGAIVSIPLSDLLSCRWSGSTTPQLGGHGPAHRTTEQLK